MVFNLVISFLLLESKAMNGAYLLSYSFVSSSVRLGTRIFAKVSLFIPAIVVPTEFKSLCTLKSSEITMAVSKESGNLLDANIPWNPVERTYLCIKSPSLLVITSFLFEPFIFANQTLLGNGCIFALDGLLLKVIISPSARLLMPSMEEVSKYSLLPVKASIPDLITIGLYPDISILFLYLKRDLLSSSQILSISF